MEYGMFSRKIVEKGHESMWCGPVVRVRASLEYGEWREPIEVLNQNVLRQDMASSKMSSKVGLLCRMK